MSSSIDMNFGPLVAFGILTVAYGSIIFYGFPYALISGSFSVLMSILFIILAGLLLGLTMLAYNF